MSRLVLGILLGIGCGVLSCLAMVPLKFPTPEEKQRALIGAFLNRLVLGFVVANITLPLPSPLSGALLGIFVSAPDAVITKSYGPILGLGAVLGAVCGWVAW